MEQQTLPPQQQNERPGVEEKMTPRPRSVNPDQRGSGKLTDKLAIITGGDSGIGRAVAVAFAKEGADVAVLYLKEHQDAEETRHLVEAEGRTCAYFAGDIGRDEICRDMVDRVMRKFGHIDILVNNAGEQHPTDDIEKITEEQLLRTFRTNVFAYFFMVKAALPHMNNGGVIVNTASVTAYRGSKNLLDYSASKGAEVAFTRSLSEALIDRGIRVNGVAPGPIWTPLIPSTLPPEKVASFGSDTPMKRPGQPEEAAACYVFLASNDSSYMSGQFLHPNGGEIVNG